MAYKTCPDCGSRIYEYGCVSCNEEDYISMQGAYDTDDEDEDDNFQPCDDCDLPDACEDFGCAIKSGVKKDRGLYKDFRMVNYK